MHSRRAVTNQAFGASVFVLILIAAVGYGLYLTKPPMAETMTETVTQPMTETMSQTMTETMTHAMTEVTTQTSTSVSTQEAIPFAARSGQMIGSALLLIEPAGMNGEYALSVYAPGLEPTMGTGNDYLVEGTQTSGSMASVPVTGNATTSEFEAGSNGVGQFFALLNQNPYSSFENVQIYYLSGMNMSNATLVATASLSMMSH